MKITELKLMAKKQINNDSVRKTLKGVNDKIEEIDSVLVYYTLKDGEGYFTHSAMSDSQIIFGLESTKNCILNPQL
jgi:hypothetical protein